MSYNTGGVVLSGQFNLKSTSPIDGRYVIVSETELKAMIADALYPGLQFTITNDITTSDTTITDKFGSGSIKAGTYIVSPDKTKIISTATSWENVSGKPKVFVIQDADSSAAPTVSDGKITIGSASYTLTKHDICIVQCKIGETTSRQYTSYVYNGGKWEAMDGNYSAANVFLSQDMVITKTFGRHTVTSGNKTAYTKGTSIEYILTDAFKESSYGTVDTPSYTFTTSDASGEVGASADTPTATFKVTDVGSYQYGPDTGITFSASFSGGTKWENNESVDNSISGTSMGDDAELSLQYTTTTTNSKGEAVTVSTVTFTDAPQKFTFSGTYSYTQGAEALNNMNQKSGYRISSVLEQSLSTESTYAGWRYMYYGGAAGESAANIVKASNKEQFSSGTHYFTVPAGAKCVVFAVPANSNTGTTRTDISVEYNENGVYVTYPVSFTKTTATIGPSHKTSGANTTTYNVWYCKAPNQDSGFTSSQDFAITLR